MKLKAFALEPPITSSNGYQSRFNSAPASRRVNKHASHPSNLYGNHHGPFRRGVDGSSLAAFVALTRLEASLRGRGVTTNIPAELPLIHVDDVLMEQVFVNLLDNAANYTPQGTSIEIAAINDETRLVLSEVWGPNHEDQIHYLRVYMLQLRRKLEADPTRPRHLRTESGVGYRLTTAHFSHSWRDS